MAKNSRIHSSIFGEEIAVRVHLLEFFDGSLQSPLRATIMAVLRIDGLERGPDLMHPWMRTSSESSSSKNL
jgi:hypothetical protein